MANEKKFPDALAEFAKMPEHLREKVVSAFEHDGPAISVELLANLIHKKTGAAQELLQGIIQGLPWLIQIAFDKSSHSDLGKVLAQLALDEEDESKLDAQLIKQMSRLLTCETSIALTAKAQNIMWGHGRVYRDAHIVSQIRPLFLSDLQTGSSNAVIVHELRLNFQVDGMDKSICVAMDSEKIRQLQAILDRALNKEESLRAANSFHYLSPARE